MPTPLETISDIQNQIVDAVKAVQDPTVQAVQAVSDLLPNLDLPFADKLPTPEAVVVGSFGFAQRLLAAQGEVALAVAQAWQRPA